jgi:hypothetical protein
VISNSTAIAAVSYPTTIAFYAVVAA